MGNKCLQYQIQLHLKFTLLQYAWILDFDKCQFRLQNQTICFNLNLAKRFINSPTEEKLGAAPKRDLDLLHQWVWNSKKFWSSIAGFSSRLSTDTPLHTICTLFADTPFFFLQKSTTCIQITYQKILEDQSQQQHYDNGEWNSLFLWCWTLKIDHIGVNQIVQY